MRAALRWWADAQWFALLAAEGWAGPVPAPLAVAHAEAERLPLLPTLPPAGRPGLCQGLSNYYSPLLEPIGGPPLQDAPGLARAWRRAGLAQLDLRPLDAQAPWVAELAAALRGAGFLVSMAPAFDNWVLELQGQSATDYLAARPGPLRTSLKRGRARLGRAGPWAVELVDAPGEALERALDDYEQVYARSWKPAEAAPRFIRRLAQWMAQRGALRLGVLRLQGQALAAQLWFVESGCAYIFKLAHVSGSEAFSPGSVLTAELMRQVIDGDRVQTVDFISGGDAYKRDWMNQCRQRIALLAFNPRRARGAWAALRHYGGLAWRGLRAR